MILSSAWSNCQRNGEHESNTARASDFRDCGPEHRARGIRARYCGLLQCDSVFPLAQGVYAWDDGAVIIDLAPFMGLFGAMRKRALAQAESRSLLKEGGSMISAAEHPRRKRPGLVKKLFHVAQTRSPSA